VSLARRVTIGTAQLTLGSILVRLLALVSMPVLTRLLEPSAYGTAALATTFISLISVIALAGADLSYIRGYHEVEQPLRQAVESLTWRFAIGSSIVAAILSIVSWSLISDSLLLPLYVGPLIAAIVILSVTVSMSRARARVHERYGAISIANVIGDVAATAIAILVAYFGPRDALPLILSLVAVYLIPSLFLGWPPAAVLIKPSGLSYAESKRILGLGAATVVTAPAHWVMSSSDRWFLGIFTDPTLVGVYSISASVAVVGLTLNSAVLTIWTPEATKLFETRPADGLQKLGSVSEAMIAALACVWLAVTASGGDLVRLLTTPAFHAGVEVIPLIAAGVFLHGVIHLSNTIYVIEKRVHHTIFWWVSGAGVNVMLSYLLVPRIGIMGAALAQLIGFAVTASGLSMGARRMLSPYINWMRLLVVCLIVFVAAIFMRPSWGDSPFLSLCMKFPIGLCVAFVLFALFRDASITGILMKKINAT
jgi:O-antigen/teichoic acid export membrane protein